MLILKQRAVLGRNWSLATLEIEAIKAINIEVSAKCNAGCPFCSRRQKIRPYPGQLISLADFKLLPISLIRQLRRLTFGGNFGDLCCNPDLVDIAAYIRQLNPNIILEGDTNSSHGDPGWWQTLGASFQKGAMVFALDGLEDTHRLHRQISLTCFFVCATGQQCFGDAIITLPQGVKEGGHDLIGRGISRDSGGHLPIIQILSRDGT